ncbi:MAG: M20/M25/M40 family metallo-hydrolase [Microbacteriaceae bacterium]
MSGTGPVAGMLDDLGALVCAESPTAEPAAVNVAAEVLAGIGERLLSLPAERVVLEGRVHLRWRLGEGARRVLMLGHVDTVWPVGTLERIPWRVDSGRARGPGCFDMKAGLVQALHAVASLPDPDGVTVLVTGDEELGAPTSRELIRAEAGRHRDTLVFEPSADGGAFKVARSGVSLYELIVHGRAAHAGLEPAAGVNAAVGVAELVLALERIGAGEADATVTPTLMSAGTSANTVPAQARLSVDVRAGTVADQQRLDAVIRRLAPTNPAMRVEVLDGVRIPPLEEASCAELVAIAQREASVLGIERPGATRVGGGSDGNTAASAGSRVLDGLGAVGGGAHAPEEHVLVATMPERTLLAAAVLARLLEQAPLPERDR